MIRYEPKHFAFEHYIVLLILKKDLNTTFLETQKRLTREKLQVNTYLRLIWKYSMINTDKCFTSHLLYCNKLLRNNHFILYEQ